MYWRKDQTAKNPHVKKQKLTNEGSNAKETKKVLKDEPVKETVVKEVPKETPKVVKDKTPKKEKIEG